MHHFGFLRMQASLCRTSAHAIWAFTTSSAAADETCNLVEKLEDDGLRAALGIETLLTRRLSAPLDREDLHALSSRLAVVLDRATHAVHACALATQVATGHRLAEHHVRMTEALERAVDALARGDYADVLERGRIVRAARVGDALLEPSASASIIAAQIRDRFAMLFRACRASGDFLTRLAIKNA